MSLPSNCPECGAVIHPEDTCQDHFHQMLAWENQFPALGEVHHLCVLCYHLQHPSLYSPEGLKYGIRLLSDFLEQGLSPADIRRRDSHAVQSDQRRYKIRGTPGAQGQYLFPIHWRMTARDVVAGGKENYCNYVLRWAHLVLEDIRLSNPLR